MMDVEYLNDLEEISNGDKVAFRIITTKRNLKIFLILLSFIFLLYSWIKGNVEFGVFVLLIILALAYFSR